MNKGFIHFGVLVSIIVLSFISFFGVHTTAVHQKPKVCHGAKCKRITPTLIPTLTPTILPTNNPTQTPTPTAAPKSSDCDKDQCHTGVKEVSDNAEEIIANIFIPRFGAAEWNAAKILIQEESGFNRYAINPTSGACGIFQSNPCSKLPCQLVDVACQAHWGADYIAASFATPSGALAFHNIHGYY